MSDRLFEVLADCLAAIEQGADMESCLSRYPHFADELRPLLVAAIQARSAAVTDIPTDAMQRGKARFMNQAAEMRERAASKKLGRVFGWNRAMRLATAAVLLLLFMVSSGTGLVYASNGAIPGDRLYPVKLTWEGIRLRLAFTPEQRQALEIEFEDERRQEVDDLFENGRDAEVEFTGTLQAAMQNGWLVGGIPVQVTSATRIDGTLQLGVFVEVEGQTAQGGVVVAQRILVRQPGSGGDSSEGHGSNSSQLAEPQSTESDSEESEPDLSGTATFESTQASEPLSFDFVGVIQDKNGRTWNISGQPVDMSSAQFKDAVGIGDVVRVKGEIGIDGVWRASEIEFASEEGGGSSSSSESSSESTQMPESSGGGSGSSGSSESSGSSGGSSGSSGSSGSGSSSSQTDQPNDDETPTPVP